MNQHQQALRLARTMLEKDDVHHICVALKYVASYRPKLQRAALHVRDYIEKQLAPHYTLPGWARANGATFTGEHAQAMRLAWIDKLIEEDFK